MKLNTKTLAALLAYCLFFWASGTYLPEVRASIDSVPYTPYWVVQS